MLQKPNPTFAPPLPVKGKSKAGRSHAYGSVPWREPKKARPLSTTSSASPRLQALLKALPRAESEAQARPGAPRAALREKRAGGLMGHERVELYTRGNHEPLRKSLENV